MFDEVNGENLLDNEMGFELLQELERNTPDEIRRQRTHFRITIKSKVTLLPGSVSEVLKFKLQGVTGDVSEGGCKLLFPLPIRVGDVYRLEFDRKVLGLPTTFVLCRRCIMLRDDAYEAGFSFFAPIALPEEVCAAAEASA